MYFFIYWIVLINISNTDTKYKQHIINIEKPYITDIIINDEIKIKLDEKIMYEQLKINSVIQDEFIKNKVQFINSFIKQRKLKVEFQIIDSKHNIAKQLLKKEIKTDNG